MIIDEDMMGPFKMDDNEGNGDGECWKGMDWIGKPVSSGCDAATPKAAEVTPNDGVPTIVGDAEGVGNISEMTGPLAGRLPYPGMPRSKGCE
jgi:hypothetical protein